MKRTWSAGAKALSVSALALFLSSPLHAQDSSGSSQGAESQAATPENHLHHHPMHRQVRENHEKMRRLMDRQDAELRRLTEEMNQAAPDKKLDRACAVINKLVEQRKEMHDAMEGMHQKWMHQMGDGK
jgi:exonuclease VII large subunit